MSENQKEFNESERRASAARTKSEIKPLRIILSAAILVLVFFAGFLTNCLVAGRTATNLNLVLKLIEQEGVFITKTPSGEDLSGDELIKAVVASALKEDKYAVYYTAEEFNVIKNENKGAYDGLGMSVYTKQSGYFNEVYSVTLNSPAEKAGLRAGDVFLAASYAGGEYKTLDQDYDVTDFFQDNPGTGEYKFKVKREGSFVEKEFTAKRAAYNASYVKLYVSEGSFVVSTDKKTELSPREDRIEGLADDAAVMRFTRFSGNAAEQFKAAAEYLKNNGKTKLVLDLRGNGGGQMTVLENVAGYLIDNGGKTGTISVCRGKSEKHTEVFSTKFNAYLSFLNKTVVIADENTASASEALLGAMLYYGAAERDNNFSLNDLVIVKREGEEKGRTYGKGIMQTTYNLVGGSALKLTTAKIYWPDGETCIHETGIIATEENSVTAANAMARALQILG